MAHICTVCHPNGEWNPANAEEHRDLQHNQSGCCYGCECGWWRHLPDEADVTRAEAFVTGRAVQRAAVERRRSTRGRQ